jgi:hypothetical protein
MGQFLNDTFSGSGTLDQHVADDGSTWATGLAGAASNVSLSGGFAQDVTGTGTHYNHVYSSGTPDSADYTVTGRMKFFSFTDISYHGVSVRCSATVDYSFVASNGSTTFHKHNSGIDQQVTNVITPTSLPLVSGSEYDWSLAVQGSATVTLTVNIQRVSDGLWLNPDGSWSQAKVTYAQATDSTDTITAAGHAGLWIGSSASSTTGVAWDQVSAATASVVPIARPAASQADIRDYGALPGPANAATTRAAYYLALASGKPTVFIPYDPEGYSSDRPLHLDVASKTIQGEQGAYLKFSGDLGLVVGLPRSPTGAGALTPDHIVSLDSYLDPWAQGRYGIATLGDTHFAQQWGNATGNLGRWLVPRVTVDLAIDLTNSTGGVSAQLLGWGNTSAPQPMACLHQPSLNRIWVRFATSDGGVLEFGVPVATSAFHRITWQIDCAAASVRCWVDRVQVAPMDTAGQLATWTPSAGRTFAEASGVPFQVGNSGPVVTVTGQEFGSPINAVICGLRVATEALYLDGTPQAFAPASGLQAQPFNDLNQYFVAASSNVSWWLPFQDAPATVASDRFVAVALLEPSGNSFARNDGWGMLIPNSASAGLSAGTGINGLSVSELNVLTSSPYGCAIAACCTVDDTYSDGSSFGGSYGFGCWDINGSFTRRISRWKSGGLRGAFRAYGSIVWAEDVSCKQSNVASIDLPNSRAGTTWRRVFVVGDTSTPAYFVRGSGNLDMETVGYDYESVFPSSALFDWSLLSGEPQVCGLRAASLAVGPIGPNAVCFDLHDQPGGSGNAGLLQVGAVIVLAALSGGPYPAFVRCSTPAWFGTIPKQVGVPASTPMLVYTGSGTSGLTLGSNYP